MFCKNCGVQMDPNAAVCVKCGIAKGQGSKFCHNCGQLLLPGAVICTSCGYSTNLVDSSQQKSKMVAGLLGIFLGGLGVHNFYLGYTGRAVIQLVLVFITCGCSCIWGLVEGIMILCGSINKDANGVPLKG